MVRAGRIRRFELLSTSYCICTFVFVPVFFSQEPVLMGPTEIARCYGNSCNAKTIRNRFDRVVRPDVKLILDTLKAGGDPERVTLNGIAKISGDNC